MAERMIPGGFLGPGGLQIPPPGPETLHVTYAAGANAGDQTLNLLDVNGGAVTIDGTAGGFTGIYGLRVLANQYISRSLTIGVDAGVQPSARLHVAAGTAVAGTASMKVDPGVLLGVTESGAVESDGTNIYWTDSVGVRWALNNAAAETLAQAYAAGAGAFDQTLGLLDARGGGLVIDATNVGFTGAVNALAINASGGTSVAFPRTGGIVTSGSITAAASIEIQTSTTAAQTLLLRAYDTLALSYSTFVTLTAGNPATCALAGTVTGSTQAPGTSNTTLATTAFVAAAIADQTLAATYTVGAAAADQTLVLLDTKGGGVAINATTPLQVFVTAFSIDVIGGSVNFYRVGGFDVSSSVSVPVAAGANWNEANFLTSTITLTGGPGTANVLSMVRIGSGITNGAGNTVTDAYNLLIDAAPAGTATLTRSWSAGFAGAVQTQAGLVLGTGLNPPTENDLVVGAGATVVSQANSGRLGYLAGATQTFMVSANGGAYVPLLVGPAAAGFTTGSVPFGLASGQLGQDNATFFWDNTNKRLGLGTTIPLARLYVMGDVTVGPPAGLREAAVFDAGGTATGDGPAISFTGFGGAVPGSYPTWRFARIGAPYAGAGAGGGWGGHLAFLVNGSATAANLIEAMRITYLQNVLIGTTTDLSASRLNVNATKTVASAAGAVWNGINFAAASLTLTGATTPITTLNFVAIVGPTITAASPVVTTDFYTCRIGKATFTGAGPASATRQWALGLDDSLQVSSGNVVLGTGVSAGTNANLVLALHNGATPPTTSVDLAQLFAIDIAAGRATLGVVTEEAVAADVGLASTHSVIVNWNGATYKLMLVLVP